MQVSTLRQLACEQMKCEHATLVASGRSLHEIDDTLQIGDVLGVTGVARCKYPDACEILCGIQTLAA